MSTKASRSSFHTFAPSPICLTMLQSTSRRTLSTVLSKSNLALVGAKNAFPKIAANNMACTSYSTKASFFDNLQKDSAFQYQGKYMSTSAKDMSDKEVNDLFLLWNNALATLDPDTVAKRYAKETILLPTVSDTPRMDYDSIKAYFVDFLQKKPQGILLESKVIKGDDWALDAGIYEFTMGATGDKVKARYTYLYNYEDGEWKIAHHHSSVMPEAFLG